MAACSGQCSSVTSTLVLAQLLLPVFAAGQTLDLTGQPLRVTSREVLLDFVVRDRNRRQVRNLKPEELQLQDNGAPQRIVSFRHTAGTQVTAEAQHPTPLAEPKLIAIVCMGMDPGERRHARTLLREFVAPALPPGTAGGVFLMHRRLDLVQSFTNQPDLLLRGIDRVTTQDYRYISESALPRPPGEPLDWKSWEGSPSLLSDLQLKMRKLETLILRNSAGQSELEGLRTLVRSMAALPGRKSVLLVSQGLLLPPDHGQWLNAIIAEANRVNLTFYTLNSAGLTTSGIRESYSPREEAAMFHTDRNDWALQTLADSTGGFWMSNSNDLRTPMRNLREEAASHYEVSYRPKELNWDGRFHRVELRVTRPKVTVQSRTGYFALPALGGELVQTFELPALAALDEDAPPSAIDFSLSVDPLATEPGFFRYRMGVRTPAGQFRPTMLAGQRSRLDVSVLVLVKDASGEVVDKLSRRITSETRLGQGPEQLSLDLPLALPPGSYTLHAAVVDLPSARAGVQRLPLRAEEPSP